MGCLPPPSIAGVAAAATGQETLVERTVAIVGGTVITLSDVRTALALGLVETAARRRRA